jgi:hypothetical protein
MEEFDTLNEAMEGVYWLRSIGKEPIGFSIGHKAYDQAASSRVLLDMPLSGKFLMLGLPCEVNHEHPWGVRVICKNHES